MNIHFTLIAQALTFAILIWFTVKFVWPPLLNAIENRQKEIADGLAAAREGKASLEMAEKKTTEVLDGAKEKSSEIVSQAEKRASEIIEEAKQNAKLDADRIIANAKSEINQEVNKAKEELRSQVASLAIEGAQKILEKEIDAKAHSAMLTKLSKELQEYMAEISTIARPYAQAVFDLAKEQSQLQVWSDTLSLLSHVVEDEAVKSVINDSKLLDTDKEKLILDICKKNINKEGENFVKLLIENKRLLILPFISEAFENLKANEEGSVTANIVVATKITKKETDEIIKNLEKKLNKKIEATVEIDQSILGGSVITVGDTVIDASVKGQLESLAFSMKA